MAGETVLGVPQVGDPWLAPGRIRYLVELLGGARSVAPLQQHAESTALVSLSVEDLGALLAEVFHHRGLCLERVLDNAHVPELDEAGRVRSTFERLEDLAANGPRLLGSDDGPTGESLPGPPLLALLETEVHQHTRLRHAVADALFLSYDGRTHLLDPGDVMPEAVEAVEHHVRRVTADEREQMAADAASAVHEVRQLEERTAGQRGVGSDEAEDD